MRYSKFYINDTEMLKVIGRDYYGHTFSSLDGFRFKWEFLKGRDLLVKVEKPGIAKR